MTEIQAHEFLSKCEKRLIWRKIADENKIIETLNQNSRYWIVVGMVWLGLAAWNFSHSKKDAVDVFFTITLSTLGLLIIGFSVWILIRMRQVRQALQKRDQRRETNALPLM